MNPAAAIAQQSAMFAERVDHLLLTLVVIALISASLLVVGLGRLILSTIAESRQAEQDEAARGKARG
jgi:Na+-translocating ferredoxin:NAD+ oxidoreductase RnfG subunit